MTNIGQYETEGARQRIIAPVIKVKKLKRNTCRIGSHTLFLRQQHFCCQVIKIQFTISPSLSIRWPVREHSELILVMVDIKVCN